MISIEEIMFKDIYSNLSNVLADCINLNHSENEKKDCPNCGTELDNRF